MIDECDEYQNQRAKIERQAGDHRGKAAHTGALLREIELNIEQQSDEMRLNEEQIQKLLIEIDHKRECIEQTARELGQVERNIEEIKLKNKEMRTVQFEQEKRVKIHQANLQDLTVSKS